VLGGGGQRGDVFFCCQSWLPQSIGNVAEQPVKEVWNSGAAQDIRRSILDGSFRHCQADKCPYLQRVDGPVQRAVEVTDDRLRAVIRDEVTELPFGPTEIICCFDQSCNLSCPSCRAGIIMETAHADAILHVQARLESEALKDARLLYITGSGDPFGSPFFRRWLQTMKRTSMPNLERIHLHTNGLLWTPRIWSSIPAETRSLVKAATISVDAATPGTYAENRRGGEFPTLLERLAFIAGLRRDGPLDFLEIHMTVQANNFGEMPAFVELGRQHHCDRVTFHKLLDWETFAPAEYAARAVQFPGHPRHQELLDTLYHPALLDPIVYLSNFTDLRQQAGDRRVRACA
jgi:MoaA/NifB/PqqE/SkfB family radical SAM enzyme